MAVNRRHMAGVAPSQVLATLCDGRSYGDWVVGTRKVREVSPQWPAPGTAIHYTVGYAPFRKDDVTWSRAFDPAGCLELEAQVWPMGTLMIVIRVEDDPGGATVVIDEYAEKGLLRTLHNPLFDVAIKARNVETLRRLEKQARRRPATV